MRSRTNAVRWAIWFALIASAVAGAGFRALHISHPESALAGKALQQSHLLHAAAYVIAVAFCARIRTDFPARSPMRLAWNLILASSIVAILRNAYEWTLALVGQSGTPLAGLRHIPLALSLILLMAALVAMWKSLARLGFGIRFRWSDYALAASILAGVSWIWLARAGMPDAGSAYASIRLLQSFSPLMIAGPALIALALHRISMEMEGGTLAISLRYLVAFLLIRMGLLAVGLVPGVAISPVWTVVRSAAAFSYTWLFVLAVAHRWQLTVSATELGERYETDPESELAALSRGIESTRVN